METTGLHRFRRQHAFLRLLILAVTWGVYSFNPPEYQIPVITLAIGLTIQNDFVIWCRADARMRGLRFIESWNQPLFFLSPIAVPGYFLWSRGLRGLLALIGYSFLLLGFVVLGGLLTGCFLEGTFPAE